MSESPLAALYTMMGAIFEQLPVLDDPLITVPSFEDNDPNVAPAVPASVFSTALGNAMRFAIPWAETPIHDRLQAELDTA